MELRKWPRKNDPASIEARWAALDGRVDSEVFGLDLTPWVGAQEALTGISVTPTAVIGPLTISLGDYELTEPDGALVERGRQTDEVYVVFPEHPWWSGDRHWMEGAALPDGFQYSSDSNDQWLTPDQLRAMLK